MDGNRFVIAISNFNALQSPLPFGFDGGSALCFGETQIVLTASLN